LSDNFPSLPANFLNLNPTTIHILRDIIRRHE
jgi:hypothetical protein